MYYAKIQHCIILSSLKIFLYRQNNSLGSGRYTIEGYPGVNEGVVQGHPLRRYILEQLSDEILTIIREERGELEINAGNIFVSSSIAGFIFERWSSHEHLITEDTNRPKINCRSVLSTFHHFRG